MILVDTNVLLDAATGDPVWSGWSVARLDAAAASGKILINDVVYAELSAGFKLIEEVDAFVLRAGVEIAPIPRSALFLAAKAFTAYRRAGGPRTGVLPDFFIGAHAAAAGLPLLTRDPRRHRTYFPTVSLVAP